MKVKINGDVQEIPDGLTVSTLLEHLGMPAGRVAVERNLVISLRSEWATTAVAPNDSFEIVHFVGGGSSR
jgi:thiamine biosynthesis protein ThiS